MVILSLGPTSLSHTMSNTYCSFILSKNIDLAMIVLNWTKSQIWMDRNELIGWISIGKYAVWWEWLKAKIDTWLEIFGVSLELLRFEINFSFFTFRQKAKTIPTVRFYLTCFYCITMKYPEKSCFKLLKSLSFWNTLKYSLSYAIAKISNSSLELWWETLLNYHKK